MQPLARLLVVTFIESFSTVLIERGIFFYSRDQLGFSDAANLGLALGFGAAYVAGALASHPLSRRTGERRLLVGSLVGLAAVHAALAAWPAAALVVVGNVLVGGLTGLKWPLVESYIGAGRTPSATVRAIGRFNVSWAAAVPLSLASAGPIIGWWPRGLFAVPVGISLATLVLVRALPSRPAHLPSDHPERPSAGRLRRYRALLASSRWSMITSYSLLWILAALLPRVYADLGFGVRSATAMSGLLDVLRFGSFVALGFYAGWHNRAAPLVWVLAGLPLGFFLTLFGGDVALVLAGEAIFGASAGMTYYAALYYAMVVKNASVDAGGAHEGLIGSGFVLGPLAGLAGAALSGPLGSEAWGMAAGVGPLVAVCGAGALMSLWRLRSKG